MLAARRAIVRTIAYAVLTVQGCGGARLAGGAPPATTPVASSSSSSSSSSSPSFSSSPSSPSASGQTLHWSGRLAAGRTIEIRAIKGSVRAVAATDDVAVLDATLKAEAGGSDDGGTPTLRIREDDAGVSLGTEEHGRRDEGCACDGSGRGKMAAMDVVVRVPAGLHLVVHTVDARIDTDGLKGPVDLHTVDGAIDLRGTTSAQARTVNGAIHAAFAGSELAEDSALSTVNGRVDVTLPGSESAELSVSTVNGQVQVEPPAASGRGRGDGRFDGRGLRLTLGHGGRSLHLRTVNGAISVKRGT